MIIPRALPYGDARKFILIDKTAILEYNMSI